MSELPEPFYPFWIFPEEFREMVAEAIDALPDDWARRMVAKNVEICVTDEPEDVGLDPPPGHTFAGACMLEKYDRLPKVIWVFRGPILRNNLITLSQLNPPVSKVDREGVEFQIRCVIEHELGHAFGLTEAEIAKAHSRTPLRHVAESATL